MRDHERRFAFVPLVVFAACGVATSSHAADPWLKEVESALAVAGERAGYWDALAAQIRLLAITVGTAGIIVAALQGIARKWVSAVVVLLGIGVGTLTVIRQERLPWASQTLEHGSSVVLTTTARIHRELADPPFESLAADGRKEVKQRVEQYLEAIEKLMEDLPRPTTRRAVSLGSVLLVGRAYAGPSPDSPEWVKKRPVDDDNLYFVGLGEGTTIRDAERESITAAREDARTYLISQLDPESRDAGILRLVDDITRDVEPVETQPAYDDRTRTYRMYTLLKISKRKARRDAAWSASQGNDVGTAALKETIGKIEGAPSPSGSYEKTRDKVYASARKSAESMLTADEYRQFVAARETRSRGQYDEAIAVFGRLVAKYPEFYLGWFNLALTSSDADRRPAALQAYGRAASLPEAQQDASLWNSFGVELYLAGRTEEAIEKFQKALAISGDHLKAQQNLALARSARPMGSARGAPAR
jgi:tetratricopeptide (TPR) repeat protein